MITRPLIGCSYTPPFVSQLTLYRQRLTILERVCPLQIYSVIGTCLYVHWYIYDTRVYAGLHHTAYFGKEKRTNKIVYSFVTTGPGDVAGLLALAEALNHRMILRSQHHVRLRFVMPECTQNLHR